MSANGKSWWATIVASLAVLVGAPSFGALSLPAHAQSALQVAETVDPEVYRISAYLDELKSFESRFVQANDDGGYVEGTIRVARPGRMRIEYDPPSPYLVVADGSFFIFVDTEMEEASYIPLALTPAQFVLRDDLGIGRDVDVTELEQDAGLVRMTVRSRDEPEAGSVTLTLNADPLMLRQWTVVDAQGAVTHVTLIDPTFNHPQDPEAFVFNNPWAAREEGGN